MTGLNQVNEDPDAIEFFRFQEYKDGSYRAIFQHELANEPGSVKCPYGKAGDLLWVRESCQRIKMDSGEYRIIFKTDPIIWGGKWKPSMHMPKDASRIWLQVEEIRVERLQDISEEDAMAEGVEPLINTYSSISNYKDIKIPNYRTGFMKIWIKINSEESWHSNPWVWVVKYKVLSTTGKPQMCYKTNEVCKYDCKGLCRESM